MFSLCSKTFVGELGDALQASDLIAQQQMACWAGWAFGATVASLVLSALAVLVAAYSLRQTRKAIAVTRDLGQAQARAYVHVVKAEHLWTNNAGPYTILLHVENVGATPAKAFEVGGEIKKVRVGEVSAGAVTRPYAMKAWTALGSKQPPTTVRLDVSGYTDLAREFINPVQDHFILVVGTVRYQDVFDTWFETDFAFYSYSTAPRAGPSKLRRPTARIKAYEPTPSPTVVPAPPVTGIETLEVDEEA